MEDYMVSTTMTRVARITRNFGLISRPQAVRPPSSTPREKRNFPPFSLRLPFQLLAVYQVVASARLCCLSLACASGRLSFAVGERYYWCTSFLRSLSTYVHTPTPHSILRFRPAPQTPDLHTSNLPHPLCWLAQVVYVQHQS